MTWSPSRLGASKWQDVKLLGVLEPSGDHCTPGIPWTTGIWSYVPVIPQGVSFLFLPFVWCLFIGFYFMFMCVWPAQMLMYQCVKLSRGERASPREEKERKPLAHTFRDQTHADRQLCGGEKKALDRSKEVQVAPTAPRVREACSEKEHEKRRKD